MRTALSDPATVQHDDLVGGVQSGQPMRDQQQSAAAGPGEQIPGERVGRVTPPP